MPENRAQDLDALQVQPGRTPSEWRRRISDFGPTLARAEISGAKMGGGAFVALCDPYRIKAIHIDSQLALEIEGIPGVFSPGALADFLWRDAFAAFAELALSEGFSAMRLQLDLFDAENGELDDGAASRKRVSLPKPEETPWIEDDADDPEARNKSGLALALRAERQENARLRAKLDKTYDLRGETWSGALESLDRIGQASNAIASAKLEFADLVAERLEESASGAAWDARMDRLLAAAETHLFPLAAAWLVNAAADGEKKKKKKKKKKHDDPFWRGFPTPSDDARAWLESLAAGGNKHAQEVFAGITPLFSSKAEALESAARLAPSVLELAKLDPPPAVMKWGLQIRAWASRLQG